MGICFYRRIFNWFLNFLRAVIKSQKFKFSKKIKNKYIRIVKYPSVKISYLRIAIILSFHFVFAQQHWTRLLELEL